MQVVLAVKGDTITSKPKTIPEGKLDISISEVCDMQHSATSVTVDPNVHVDPNAGYTDMIPGDENWNNDNFGIQ